MPRKRSVPKGRANIAAESLAGRTYADFCAPPGIERACAVETGAVVGRQGRDAQCVLALFFRLTKLQVFMLLPDKTAASVVAALDSLEAVCGESFGALFGTVLCDRGCEFADVAGIEGSANGGGRRLRLFFCDPMQSQQKGGAEKNHVELRKCLPKGRTDFDALTQGDMAACMSHVNSYARESLSWAAPTGLAGHSCPELLAGLGDRGGPGRGGEPDAVPRPACDAEGLGSPASRGIWALQESGNARPRAPRQRGPGAAREAGSHRAPPSIPRVGQNFRGPRPADSQRGTESAVLPRILPQKLCYVMGINPQLTVGRMSIARYPYFT